MTHLYVLEGHTPALCGNMARWAECCTPDMRRVKLTRVGGVVDVSTVFLGIDHRMSGPQGPPILFETMVFKVEGAPPNASLDSLVENLQDRYCTWDEAVKGHDSVVLQCELFLPEAGEVQQ